ncbi:hypothetical protein [Dactylosporangium sp. CA-233914]|uniref:hypothetical protein n=1 Tax=Dactylosporangium sp. CA-233914 TaxID=3239934 RepID=UPI003D8FFB54
MLNYAKSRPAGKATRIVLDGDLLNPSALEQFLVPFVTGISPLLRAAIVIDTGALQPLPSATDALTAANRLTLPIELPLSAIAGFGDARLEYRDAEGLPTFRPFATTLRVLPSGAPNDASVLRRFRLRRTPEPDTYALTGGWVVQVFPRGLWVRPAGAPGDVPAALGPAAAADAPPRLMHGVRGVVTPAAVARRVAALRDALPAGTPVVNLGPPSAAERIAAGVYLPPGDTIDVPGEQHLSFAETLPNLGEVFGIVVHVRDDKLLWDGHSYGLDNAGAFVAALGPVAEGLGRPLEAGPVALITTMDSDRWSGPEFADRITKLARTELIVFERLGVRRPDGTVEPGLPVDDAGPPALVPVFEVAEGPHDAGPPAPVFAVAEGTAVRHFPYARPPEPVAAELEGVVVPVDALPPGILDDASAAGPPGLYSPQHLERLEEHGSLGLDRARLPGLIEALGIPGRSPTETARSQHIDALIRLSQVTNRVPDDLPELAVEFGFDDPWSLYLLVRELGVDPRSLRVIGNQLRAVAGTARLGTGRMLDELRTRLTTLGVHVDADLVWLLELGVRHEFTPSDLAVLAAVIGRGTSLELLHDLPAATVERLLLRQRQRIAEPTDPVGLVRQWRLVSLDWLHALADELRTVPEDLAELYGDHLDAAASRFADEHPDVEFSAATSDERRKRMPHWVKRLAGAVRRALGVVLDLDAAQVEPYLKLTGELGFVPTELTVLPPGRHRNGLVARAFSSQPFGAAEALIARLPRAGQEQSLPAYDAAAEDPLFLEPVVEGPLPVHAVVEDPPAYNEDDALAGLGVRPHHIADLANRLGLRVDPDQEVQLVARLVTLTVRIGRLPTDLGSLAYRIGTAPAVLLALAAELRADPRHLLPFRGLIRRTKSALFPGGIPAAEILSTLREVATIALRGTSYPADEDGIAHFFYLVSHSKIDSRNEMLFRTRLRWAALALRRSPLFNPLDDLLDHTLPWLSPSQDLGPPPPPRNGREPTDPFASHDPYNALLLPWWAGRFGTSEYRIGQVIEQQRHLDLDAVADFAAATGVSWQDMLGIATMTGRVPFELPDLAAAWQVAPAELAKLALTGSTPPHLLAPFTVQGRLAIPTAEERDRRGRAIDTWGRALKLGKEHVLALMSDTGLVFAEHTESPVINDGAPLLWRAVLWGVSPAEASRFAVELTDEQHEQLFTTITKFAAVEPPDVLLLEELAARLRISSDLLAAYSVRIGRVPVDLPDLAQWFGVDDPVRLLAVASLAGVDVRDLHDTDGLRSLNASAPGAGRLAGVAELARAVRERIRQSRHPAPARDVVHDLLHVMVTTKRAPDDILALADSADGAVPVAVLLSASRDLDVDPRLVARFIRWRTHQAGLAAVRGRSVPPALPTEAAAVHLAIVEQYPDWARDLDRDYALAGDDIWSFFSWLDEDHANRARFPGSELDVDGSDGPAVEVEVSDAGSELDVDGEDGPVVEAEVVDPLASGRKLVETWLTLRFAKAAGVAPLGVERNLQQWNVTAQELLRFARGNDLRVEDVYRAREIFAELPYAAPAIAATLGIPAATLLSLAVESEMPPRVIAVVADAADLTQPVWSASARWWRRLHEAAEAVGWTAGWLGEALADLGVALPSPGHEDELRRHLRDWAALVFGFAPEQDAVPLRIIEIMMGLIRSQAAGVVHPDGVERLPGLAARLDVSFTWLATFSVRNGMVPDDLDPQLSGWSAAVNRRLMTVAARLDAEPGDISTDVIEWLAAVPARAWPAALDMILSGFRADAEWSAAHPPRPRFASRLLPAATIVERLGIAAVEMVELPRFLRDAGMSIGQLTRSEVAGAEITRFRAGVLASMFHRTEDDVEDDLLDRPWLRPADLETLARRGLGAFSDLRELSLDIGRVPADITELSGRAGLPPQVLLKFLTTYDRKPSEQVDPRLLRPLLEHDWQIPPSQLASRWGQWLSDQRRRLHTSSGFLLSFMADEGLGVEDVEQLETPDEAMPVRFAAWLREVLHLTEAELQSVLAAAPDGYTILLGALVAGEGWDIRDLRREAALLGVGWPRLAALSLATRRPVVDVARAARRFGVDAPGKLLALASQLGTHLEEFNDADDLQRLNTMSVADVAATIATGEHRSTPRSLGPLLIAMAEAVQRYDLSPAEAKLVMRELADQHRSIVGVPTETLAKTVARTRADHWSATLGVDATEIEADLVERPWLIHHQLHTFTTETMPGEPFNNVWQYVRVFGWIPDHLPARAERLRTDVHTLFRVASRFGVDSAYVSPILRLLEHSRDLDEQLSKWFEWLAERASAIGVGSPTLLEAMHDSGLTLRWSDMADELRVRVELWQATQLGLGRNAFRALRQQPKFSMRTAVRILDVLVERTSMTEAIARQAREFGVTSRWLFGVYLRLGQATPRNASTADLRQALADADQLDDPDTVSGPLSLLEYLGPNLRVTQLVDIYQDAFNRIDIGGLSPEVRRAYFSYVTSGKTDAGPLRQTLLGSVGTPRQRPGTTPVRIVHAAESATAPTAHENLYLHLHRLLPGTDGVTGAGAAVRFHRALNADAILSFDTQQWYRLDELRPKTVNEVVRAIASADGFGRFLDDAGRVVPGFAGVINHIASVPAARGIVVYRTRGADGDPAGNVLNVFAGKDGEVVFVDPLAPALAVLPAGDTVDVLYLPTADETPASFVPVGGDTLDELFSWPPPALSDLGETAAGRFLLFAARSGQWIGALKPSIVRHYVEAWNILGRPAEPYDLAGESGVPGAMAGLHAALLNEAGTAWPLPGGLTVTVVHASSGPASTPDPATNAARLLLLEHSGVPRAGVSHPPVDDVDEYTRAFALDRHRAGAGDPGAFAPEPWEALPGELALHFPDSGGFVRFLSPSGDPVSGFDGVIHQLATAPGQGFVIYRKIDDLGMPIVRLLNVFTGRHGEVVFVDPLSAAPAELPVGGRVDVLFLPTAGTVDAHLTEPVDSTVDWADTLADLTVPAETAGTADPEGWRIEAAGGLGRAFVDPAERSRLGLDRIDLSNRWFARIRQVGADGSVSWYPESDEAVVPWDSLGTGYVAAFHGDGDQVRFLDDRESWATLGSRLRRRPSVRNLRASDFVILPGCGAADLGADGRSRAQAAVDQLGRGAWVGRYGMMFLGDESANIGLLPGPNGEPGEWVWFSPDAEPEHFAKQRFGEATGNLTRVPGTGTFGAGGQIEMVGTGKRPRSADSGTDSGSYTSSDPGSPAPLSGAKAVQDQESQVPSTATTDGRLIVIGAGKAPVGRGRETLRTVAEAVPFPVLAMESADALPDLIAAVEQLRWRGHKPVVFLSRTVDAVVRAMRQQQVAMVYKRSARLDDEWQVEGPAGPADSFELAELRSAVEHAHALSQTMPEPDRPPAKLADWLSAGDWAAARGVFTEHRALLLADDLPRRLEEIADRSPNDHRLKVFQAVLELARAGHADVAFDYLGQRRLAERHRLLLLAAWRDAVPSEPLERLIRSARRADAGTDTEVVLQIATETVLVTGEVELSEDDRKAILCLEGARRADWMQERRHALKVIEDEKYEFGPVAKVLLDEALHELAMVVVDCEKKPA